MSRILLAPMFELAVVTEVIARKTSFILAVPTMLMALSQKCVEAGTMLALLENLGPGNRWLPTTTPTYKRSLWYSDRNPLQANRNLAFTDPGLPIPSRI
ncbi:hypothetical protein A3709_12080 [Halioglobus sp. HI00S01]|nr:hypothetical protein A3709_12080 [Halioglobus sp. HI00S01]